MPTSSTKGPRVIAGTPMQCGRQAFDMVREVFLRAIQGQPAAHVIDFYAGLISAAALGMAEDVSHAQAAAGLRRVADGLEAMGEQINAAAKH